MIKQGDSGTVEFRGTVMKKRDGKEEKKYMSKQNDNNTGRKAHDAVIIHMYLMFWSIYSIFFIKMIKTMYFLSFFCHFFLRQGFAAKLWVS